MVPSARPCVGVCLCLDFARPCNMHLRWSPGTWVMTKGGAVPGYQSGILVAPDLNVRACLLGLGCTLVAGAQWACPSP